GEEGAIGPDLSDIGALNTVEYIKESILYPNAKILKGYGIVDFRTKGRKRVEGLLVGENDRSLTVKGEGKERNYLKEKILFRKVRPAETRNLSGSGYFWVRARLPGKAEIEGAIVDENSLEVEVRVAGESKVIKKSDIENIEGRRILRTSKMPRYDHVLTISEFNDLLAYVVSLRGKTVVGQ
ncbi:MAG: hypothetical protein ACE5FU_12520, partial [Nitrospinota bacterium]